MTVSSPATTEFGRCQKPNFRPSDVILSPAQTSRGASAHIDRTEKHGCAASDHVDKAEKCGRAESDQVAKPEKRQRRASDHFDSPKKRWRGASDHVDRLEKRRRGAPAHVDTPENGFPVPGHTLGAMQEGLVSEATVLFPAECRTGFSKLLFVAFSTKTITCDVRRPSFPRRPKAA